MPALKRNHSGMDQIIWKCDESMKTTSRPSPHSPNFYLTPDSELLIQECRGICVAVTSGHRALLIRALENFHTPDGSQLPINCSYIT
ncbi:hypothetical protein AVEN_121774-1 [Araneus ventricosus]|uniref:Uncharacterized protein n=1 Tax=Araneus ventricosus TaxID=182803 RepID=A0A4Y2L4V3_ARAVE|nr:hypothetical protein AVEN_121774-1 [Araneus ventricosus]